MPTEEELRNNPLVQYPVGDEVLWFDEDMFFVAPADTGDAGDAFETYEEAVESLS